jgi:hypothetical protein
MISIALAPFVVLLDWLIWDMGFDHDPRRPEPFAVPTIRVQIEESVIRYLYATLFT